MRDYLRSLRVFFAYAGGYSLVINLLMIVPSLYILQVFDRVLSSRSNETLLVLSALAVGALLVGAVFDVLRSKLLVRAALTLEAEMNPRVLVDLLDDSANPTGATNPHALRDVAAVRAFLAGPGLVSIFDLPWLPAYLLLIFAFHPLLGAIALAGGALLFGLAYLNELSARHATQALQTETRRAQTFSEQSVRNAEVVTALGMSGNLARAYAEQMHRALGWQVRTTDRASLFGAMSRLTRQLLQMVMMAAGAYLVINLHTSPGVMIAATLLLGRALAPIESVIASWKSLLDARAAYARLNAQFGAIAHEAARIDLPAPTGALQVERLVFGVAGREAPVLQGISFDLAAGESLAIIGPSASGKSTLARLLMGVWQPHAGQVRLDGAELRQWQRERLGVHMGYLPQDVELFSGTVAQNIARMGEVQSEDVIAAARRAGVHEMILRLPQGYETLVGTGGAFLSGGQRQRLALARALYGEPTLVVLDEPNANLDAEGELALLNAIKQLKQAGSTVVMVVHRPSLLRDIDKVLVLRDGRIEHFGARDEVMTRLVPSVQRIPPNAVPVERRQVHA